MAAVITFGRWGLIGLLAGFGAIIFWKLMTSGVRMSGMLLAQDGTVSPGRVQLLLATVFTAFQYLLQTLHDPSHLPDIPNNLVTMMAASQGVYLAAKAWSLFGPKQNK